MAQDATTAWRQETVRKWPAPPVSSAFVLMRIGRFNPQAIAAVELIVTAMVACLALSLFLLAWASAKKEQAPVPGSDAKPPPWPALPQQVRQVAEM